MSCEVQLTFSKASVGNKSLGESVASFPLTGSLDSPSAVSIDVMIAFSMDSNKIRLLIAEILLRASAGDLARSKKQRYWTPRNAVLLLPFLTEAKILDVKTSVEEFFKIFTRSITERLEEEENDNGNKDDDKSKEEE